MRSFGDDQQKRLAAFCRRLDKAGHRWSLSNSDPHNVDPGDMFFEKLFDGFDIHRVAASGMINSNAEGRGKITELAIRNYEEEWHEGFRQMAGTVPRQHFAVWILR